MLLTSIRDFTVSMLPLDKRDPQFQTLWKLSETMMPWSTLLLLQPLPQKLPLSSSWLLILDVLLESTSEIMESTPLSSMMISQNKPLLTDKCPSFWEDLLVERPTQEMSFISTLVSWKELLKWIRSTEVAHSLPSQSLKPRLVMCLPISQQMSSQLLMDRFSWKLSFSIKVSDLPLTLVSLCPESDLLLRLRPWNRLLVLSN